MQAKLTRVLAHAATAYVVLALGFALSVAAAYWRTIQAEHAARQNFDDTVSDARDAVAARIQEHADVLLGIRGLFIAVYPISREKFRDYIASLDLSRRYPGIQVIHYSQHLVAAQRQAFEAMVRADTSIDSRGYADFAIKPPG